MTHQQIAAKRLLVPVDFSALSAEAIEYAAIIARALNASITLLHVYESADAMSGIVPGADAVKDVKEARAGALLKMEALIKGARCLDGIPVKPIVEAGYTTSSILEHAREGGIDLIVMGTHGHTGLNRWLMGSVAQSVLRGAPCRVLIVHHREAPPADGTC